MRELIPFHAAIFSLKISRAERSLFVPLFLTWTSPEAFGKDFGLNGKYDVGHISGIHVGREYDSWDKQDVKDRHRNMACNTNGDTCGKRL